MFHLSRTIYLPLALLWYKLTPWKCDLGWSCQLSMDIKMMRSLQQSPGWYETQMLGLAAMASQTPMDDTLGDRHTNELIVKGLATAIETAFPSPRKGRM